MTRYIITSWMNGYHCTEGRTSTDGKHLYLDGRRISVLTKGGHVVLIRRQGPPFLECTPPYYGTFYTVRIPDHNHNCDPECIHTHALYRCATLDMLRRITLDLS